MHPTTNPLLLLIIISTASFFAGGSLQPLHRHGGGCIPAERAALLSFKKGIKDCNLLASWRGRDCCRWRGVTCSNRTSHVMELHLRNPNPGMNSLPVCDAANALVSEQRCAAANALVGDALFGEISPSLLSLEHLEHIDLSMNCLTGPSNRFPEFLGLMENLRYLNLSDMPFTGRMPSMFGNLSKLQYLDLGQMYFDSEMYSTDISWLTNLPLLQYLSLSGVNLTGIADWSRILNMLPSLRVIRLDGCSLDSANQSIPYLNLTKIEMLDLSWNKFHHTIASSWFWKATSIKHLNLQGNTLFGQFPDALGNMTSLQVLDLSFNWNKDLMMKGNVKNLCSLEILDLSNNFINGDITLLMEWLPECAWKKLQELCFSLNSFTGTLPNLIGKFTDLHILDLSINDLSGSIPPGIRHLTSLTTLDLSNNHLSGCIPPWIRHLTSLTTLHLFDNNLTGSIPSGIRHLTSLTTLLLSSNHLSGSIPPGIRHLTSLTNLDLSSNNLSGSIPPGIRHLTSLTTLDLSSNLYSGIVPSEIGALANLTSLDLSKNNFSGVIKEEHFASLVSLKEIDLSSNNVKIAVDSDWVPPFMLWSALFAYCQMGPLFPSWLQRQLQITELDISSTALKDKIPDWFWSTFSKAINVDISNNQISGRLPAHLDGMSFAKLNLSSNRLTGPIPILPGNITVLDISNNTLSGTLPSNLEAPILKTFLMYSNQIGGSIPESICKLQQLEDLDLSSNLLEGEIPQCFEAKSMRYLLLSNNSLSGKFPAFLQNMEGLEFLDLAWNKFSGWLPSWIGELTKLRFLRLSHNAFSGNIPVEITNLSYLQYLDLAGNNISGVIPWHLSNLTGMTIKGFMPIFDTTDFEGLGGLGYFTAADQFGEILSIITKGQQLRYGGTFAYFVSIDLSGNSLIGEIPTDITSLDGLINLNLSSNQLSGNIPNKIGSLQSLESLDLSKNKLSGEIPSSLSSLTSLSYLNLSYNNLSGRIPSGRQLDTLNADNPSLIYIGNSGLCGPPLQKNCSGNDTIIHGYLRSNKQEFEPMTFYFGLVVGLVVGLWMVFCALLFKKTWRIAYFQLFDKLYDKIYVFLAVNWASLARKAPPA